jgi:type II secretory pathway pseudopilin PulG
VELLIVMAILGILAGLLAWGVNAARVAILKRAQAFEVQSIASAVEAYRTKYGDYPPDGKRICARRFRISWYRSWLC